MTMLKVDSELDDPQIVEFNPLFLIFQVGEHKLPRYRYVTDGPGVRKALADLYFGGEQYVVKRELEGLEDYFANPRNWYCGQLQPMATELGTIGALQLRSK
jgi:hypothetical protein